MLVFWAVTPRGLQRRHERLGGTHCLHFQYWIWRQYFPPKRWQALLTCLRVHTASKPTRPTWATLLPTLCSRAPRCPRKCLHVPARTFFVKAYCGAGFQLKCHLRCPHQKGLATPILYTTNITFDSAHCLEQAYISYTRRFGSRLHSRLLVIDRNAVYTKYTADNGQFPI